MTSELPAANTSDEVKIRGYFINVSRMSRRRVFMQEQIEVAGLGEAIHRWKAVDAADPNDLAAASYTPGHWRSPKWELTPTEIAIFESHRNIWKHMIELGMPFVLVLEDDMFLAREFRSSLLGILSASVEFDVIKLDRVPRARRFGPSLPLKSGSGTTMPGCELRPMLQNINSAGGYLVSTTGARKLVEWSTPYWDGVDDFLFRPRPGYRLLQCFPAICAQCLTTKSVNTSQDRYAELLHGELPVGESKQVRNKGPIPYRMMRESQRGLRRLWRRIRHDPNLQKSGGLICEVPLTSDLEDIRRTHDRD